MKNFAVYKSSAGSGKTFTLVKEYLKLALYDPKKLSFNYKYILAVTFTNKAAAEMKERIITTLWQIINDTEMPFAGQALCEELIINEQELRFRSQTLLSCILHHYSDFSVGTIDSFTHKLVKTFAHDLKLPVNFNVELNIDNFYETVITSLINKIGEDKYISKLLTEYALNKVNDNSSWDPEKHIKEFVKILHKENSEDYLKQLNPFNDELFDEVRKEMTEFISYYKTTLKSLSKKTIDLIYDNNLAFEDFYHGKNGGINFFYKCYTNHVTIDDTRGTRLKEALNSNKWSSKTNKSNIVESISSQLSQNASELVTFIETNFESYSLCSLISRQLYPILLLKKIEEISLEKKQEEQIVFISEFNKSIFNLINNEPTPFIYERLGDKYRHFLLDEFQDTSTLQFQNLLPLLDNSLANGWFNLIVGDGKQSIYRWRNANVKQFSILPQLQNNTGSAVIEERANTLSRYFKEYFLNTNYRSVQTIVDFNNNLFNALSNSLLNNLTQPIYKGQIQNIKNTNIGYVTINTGKTEKETLDELNFKLVKDYISDAIKNNFKYSDICIITRKVSDGNKIANFLVENNLPVVSNDSLLLKSNFEVNTLVAFLKYLVNGTDIVSAACVLNYAEKTALISPNEFIGALEKLGNQTSLFEILNTLNITISESNYNLSNILDNCIQFICDLRLNKNGETFLRFFLDEVNEYLVTKNSNLTYFLEWWENRSQVASIAIPESLNAIKIMTIHASKGLEFPVVIVPYCNWQQYKAGDVWVNLNNPKTKLPVAVVNLTKNTANIGLEKEFETEMQEQTLDNLNLLYVAFTRAVNRLHIITASATSNKQALIGLWIEDYLKTNFTFSAENLFAFGDKTAKPGKHKKNNVLPFELSALVFNSTKNIVRIKSSYLGNSINVEEAKQQGIIMHKILSQIKTENDVAKVLNSEILNGLISENEFTYFQQKIMSVIQHPKLKSFYKHGIVQKSEAELITFSGELLRPDKIVFLEKETIIIDYKTGKLNNKKYFGQLNNYKNALSNMGYTNIKPILVYIDELFVIEEVE